MISIVRKRLGPPLTPKLVEAARTHLAARFAHGADKLMWQTQGLPMHDLDAVEHVLRAAHSGEADAEDLAAALIASEAARLDLDRIQADLLDSALQAGLTWDQIASTMELNDAATAQRRHQELNRRRQTPTAAVSTPQQHPSQND